MTEWTDTVWYWLEVIENDKMPGRVRTRTQNAAHDSDPDPTELSQ